MLLAIQILGVWTFVAIVAGTLLGRAISADPPPPPRPPLIRGRAMTSAAAGSALAALGVLAVMATTLRDGIPSGPAAETPASADLVAASSPGETSAAAAAPTSLQDLRQTGRSARGATADTTRPATTSGAPPPDGIAATAAQATTTTDPAFPASDAPTEPTTAAAPAPDAPSSTVDAPAPAPSDAESSAGTQTASTPSHHRHHRPHRHPGSDDPPRHDGGPQARPPDGGHDEAPAPDADGGQDHKLPLPDLLDGHG